ncbi:MAG: UDP-N-acetylmuramate dehydrogenase [Candidatus Vogelbacteria bacterium]|nr:UDP-N-acetylmuramate dehydrogenase [Candidatus Vogelbacteria bacterium]
MTIRHNVRVAAHTTFGVGGLVSEYWRVRTPEALVGAVQAARARGQKHCLLAGGSNVVFGDKKYDGLVIHYLADPKASPCQWQGEALTCEAGLALSRLIASSVKHGLAGLEALSGIPGTVGGAVVGNAGAYGQCISDHLTAVQIFDPFVKHRVFNKGVRWFNKSQCRFAYRDSIFKHKPWLVLRIKFKLKKGDKKTLAAKSREIIKIRARRYPSGLRCPGSFFKNVLVKAVSKKALAKIDQTKIIAGKIPAGYLLEAVGAKGLKLGGLKIADFHGNLLVNTGRATFADVKKLATLLKTRVHKKFGLELEEEVRYL